MACERAELPVFERDALSVIPDGPFGPPSWEMEVGRTIAKHFIADHLRRMATFSGYDGEPAKALIVAVLNIARGEVGEWISVVGDLIDDGPCRYDGAEVYCLTHDIGLRPCPHERARDLAFRPSEMSPDVARADDTPRSDGVGPVTPASVDER